MTFSQFGATCSGPWRWLPQELGAGAGTHDAERAARHGAGAVQLGEDQRRLAWSRHPNGVFVISALRMIALGILALARKLSRLGSSLETPTWQQVAEHFLLVLCDPVLDTGAFDAAQ